MTPAKRERLEVLGRKYTLHIRNQGDQVHPVTEPDSDISLSDHELDNFERRIERDFEMELDAEENASTIKLLKSKKFLLIYAMSVTEFLYPIYFDLIFKEIG